MTDEPTADSSLAPETLVADVDDDLAAVVQEVERMGVPEWHAMSVGRARRVEDELFGGEPTPEVETVRDLAFDGPDGEVPVRVYRPGAADDRSLPTVVFYHGGGWVLGTLDSIDGVCRTLADRLDALVVSVDYRLAPEHPFPAGLDDCYAALAWTERTAASLGGDPERLAVAGTSAGGNLAAAVAMRARDAGPDLAAQALLYPIVGRDFDAGSYVENADGPLLTRRDMEWFWEQYLRSPVDAANPFAVPLHAVDLAGLAPAVVATAGHDPLRDEGIAYAERLAEAGVETTLQHHPRLAHGFYSLTDQVPAAEEAFDGLVRALAGRLETEGA